MSSRSYCYRFGEHKGDPCPCGWSSAADDGRLAAEINEALTRLGLPVTTTVKRLLKQLIGAW